MFFLYTLLIIHLIINYSCYLFTLCICLLLFCTFTAVIAISTVIFSFTLVKMVA